MSKIFYVIRNIMLLSCFILPVSQVMGQAPANLEEAVAEFAIRPLENEFNGFVDVPYEELEFEGDFSTWWSQRINTQMNRSSNPVNIDLETLLVSALEHSKQVMVFSDLPLIRRTAITEADSAFDWSRYLDTAWNDFNDPVGSTLTTGGPPRLETQEWSGQAGLKRRNRLGGQLDVGQEFGTERSNSVFFIPNDQGTARLALSYTHPLRRGSGQFYNNSLIVLAQIDANIAQDEFLRQLQSHLLEVTRAYWSLYLERASLVQQERLYQRSKSTLEDVRGRQVMDATNSQLIRVQAAVADRRASLVRAQTAVRNAQERVIALVNDPELNQVGSLELVPLDAPTDFLIPVDMETSVRTALRSRPEVSQALRQIHAGCRRLGMARNEMLPQLDLVLRGYLAGLSGNDDVGRAWVEQFTEGEPSYSVGLNYEIPIGNRLARARMKRRRLEVRQLRNQFDTTVETLLLEVKTAVREVDTAFREMVAKYQSMVAADLQLNSIQERWKALPGEGKSAALYLEDLLDAQQKLTTIENEYLTANATYNLALMNLKKAQGTLLLDENILVGEANLDCLPTIQLHKANDLARTSETPPLERFDTEKSVQQQSVATVVDVKENGPTIPKMAKVKSVKATSRKVTSRRPWKRNTPEKILKFAGRSGPNKSALVRQSSKSFKEAPRTKPSKSNKVESFVEPIFDKGLQPQPQDARYASSPSVMTRR